MKIFPKLIAIAFFMYSCGGSSSKSIDPVPILVKVQILAINEQVKESGQTFIDAAAKAILDLESYPTSNIDFEKLKMLLEKASADNKQAIIDLNNVLDNEISDNYKNSYKNVLTASQEMYLEFDKWIDLVQDDRQSSKVEEIRNLIFEKTMTWNEKQIQFEQTQNEFNKKHKL